MSYSILRLHKGLLALALFLCPFLSSLNTNFLGGLGREASFYPTFLGATIFFVQVVFFHVKVYLPSSKSFLLFVGFFIAIILSGCFNFFDLLTETFKGISGIQRYIIQTGTVVLYIFSALYAYNIFRRMNIRNMDFFLSGLSGHLFWRVAIACLNWGKYY